MARTWWGLSKWWSGKSYRVRFDLFQLVVEIAFADVNSDMQDFATVSAF
jgi:hypothetical protein